MLSVSRHPALTARVASRGRYPAEPAGSASRVLTHTSGTSSVPLWQALRATTAAPSYFKGAEIEGIETPADDGTHAASSASSASSASAHTAAAPPPPPPAKSDTPGGPPAFDFDAAAANGMTGSHEVSGLLRGRPQPAKLEPPPAAPETVPPPDVGPVGLVGLTDGMGAIDADHPDLPNRSVATPAAKSIFQDGGLLANNPAALALHEARLLFPHAPIACLASFGTGLFPPSEARAPGSWSAIMQAIVRAATRTEEVRTRVLARLLTRSPSLTVASQSPASSAGASDARRPSSRPPSTILPLQPTGTIRVHLDEHTAPAPPPLFIFSHLLPPSAVATFRFRACASTRSPPPRSRSSRPSAAPMCRAERARRTAPPSPPCSPPDGDARGWARRRRPRDGSAHGQRHSSCALAMASPRDAREADCKRWGRASRGRWEGTARRARAGRPRATRVRTHFAHRLVFCTTPSGSGP